MRIVIVFSKHGVVMRSFGNGLKGDCGQEGGMCMSRKDASAYLGVMELRTCDYNRLGNTQHRL
mgnify:CR=1 FL=1